MPIGAREEVRGTSGQDLSKINNNFMNIWKTLFGGIDYAEFSKGAKEKIQTQWIQVQGDGNFDRNYPYRIRFFVPPNVDEIKSTNINLICERYRMDSDITASGGGIAEGSVNLSIAGGGGYAGASGGFGSSTTTPVSRWYNTLDGKVTHTPPDGSIWVNAKNVNTNNRTDWITGTTVSGGSTLGVAKRFIGSNNGNIDYVDLFYFNHEHDVNIPNHSHSINISPHSHNGNASINIPNHTHSLNEGIRVSTQNASGVAVKLNGTSIAGMDSNANSTSNNINVPHLIKKGDWNIIEVSGNIGRINVYGTVEVVQKI